MGTEICIFINFSSILRGIGCDGINSIGDNGGHLPTFSDVGILEG